MSTLEGCRVRGIPNDSNTYCGLTRFEPHQQAPSSIYLSNNKETKIISWIKDRCIHFVFYNSNVDCNNDKGRREYHRVFFPYPKKKKKKEELFSFSPKISNNEIADNIFILIMKLEII